MGKSTWRLQELALLEEIDRSEEGRKFREAAEKRKSGWFGEAVRYYVQRYLDNFKDHRFEKETVSEFLSRQQRMPTAKITPFEAETEDDHLARLRKIRKCIENYIKLRSPNNNRKKKNAPPARTPSSASGLLPIAKAPVTSGLQEFKKSGHAAKPALPIKDTGRTDFTAYNAACKDAYDQLPERELFEQRARERNEQRSATPSQPREMKVKEFPQWFGEVCNTIGLEIGWIGWFPIGGLDENGEIKAIFPSVGSLHGVTFEEWLAKKIGWSVRRLRNEFDNFLQDVFDPPAVTMQSSDANATTADGQPGVPSSSASATHDLGSAASSSASTTALKNTVEAADAYEATHHAASVNADEVSSPVRAPTSAARSPSTHPTPESMAQQGLLSTCAAPRTYTGVEGLTVPDDNNCAVDRLDSPSMRPTTQLSTGGQAASLSTARAEPPTSLAQSKIPQGSAMSSSARDAWASSTSHAATTESGRSESSSRKGKPAEAAVSSPPLSGRHSTSRDDEPPAPAPSQRQLPTRKRVQTARAQNSKPVSIPLRDLGDMDCVDTS
ncbi:hypothetical protein NUW54_g4112 [Trametes sanguinea]|uniref:Uncharacterized protein n=1 Tax=Trametes sanguinea TaxID=158606 RepID=A0ACC1Q0I3_9APHY|nr:hypothetical protein NUW54_g4112 [Trametes sanguinea]